MSVSLTSEERRRQTRLGWVFGCTAAVIWGGFLAASRQAIGSGLLASDLAFLRYAVAGPLLLPWLLRHDLHGLANVGWRRGLVLAILAGPLFIIVGASGYRFAPLAHGAVIQLGTLSLVAALLSILLLGERPGLARFIGLATIVTGLGLTAGPEVLTDRSMSWIGDLLFVLAGTMWALFTVLLRRWRVLPLTATAIVSVLSAIVYIPIYIFDNSMSVFTRASPAMLVEQLVVQGLLSAIVALFAFGQTIEYLGPSRAALFPVLAPAVAIVIGIPLTGDRPTTLQIAGLLTLSAGLLIALKGTATTRWTRPYVSKFTSVARWQLSSARSSDDPRANAAPEARD